MVPPRVVIISCHANYVAVNIEKCQVEVLQLSSHLPFFTLRVRIFNELDISFHNNCI